VGGASDAGVGLCVWTKNENVFILWGNRQGRVLVLNPDIELDQSSAVTVTVPHYVSLVLKCVSLLIELTFNNRSIL
jgi:hypothetical protein